MKLLVTVDQAAALRAGIDAPHSTTQIEVDPGSLSQAYRDVIADHLRDGHDLSRVVQVVSPSLDGLVKALDELLAKRAAMREEQRTRREKADAAIRRLLGQTTEQEIEVRLSNDGSSVEYGFSGVGRKIVVPRAPHCDTFAASEEMRQAWHVFEADVERQRQEAMQALLPELIAERDAKKAEAAAAEAKRQAEYDALYARLHEATRARHADGYAYDYEIDEAICDLLRQDAGLSLIDYDAWKECKSLTDEEHATLREIRERLPQGATFELIKIWRDEPDHPEADDDGHVDEGKLVEIHWTVGGVRATAHERL